MVLREVFFAVCVLLVLVSPGYAGPALVVTGSVSPHEACEEWRLSVEAAGPWSFAAEAVASRAGHLINQPSAAWQLGWTGDWISLQAGRGWTHVTDPSVFRLINKNNTAPETEMFVARLGGGTVGVFSRLPLQDRLAGAVFGLLEQSLGGFNVLGLHINYDTGFLNHQRRAGRVAVLQGSRAAEYYTSTFAAGWHWQEGDQLARAWYYAADCRGSATAFQLEALRVDPGFESLFASTNRLTPNRQGWTAALTRQLGPVTLELRGRALWNVEGGRTYPRLEALADFHRLGISTELRLLPTKALIFSWKNENSTWQFDPLRHWLRVDWELGRTTNRFNLDLQGGIARFQTAFTLGSEWRIVYKRDYDRSLTHFSALARLKRKRGFLQLEWGEYDRGNLRAGFDQVPTWRISWECKF